MDKPEITPCYLVQGASRGVGLALVAELAQRPETKTVYATSRSPHTSEALNEVLSHHPDRICLLPIDVTQEDTIAKAAQMVAKETPVLHGLINAAGVLHTETLQPERRLEHVTPEALQTSFAVNAWGPLLMAKHFVPLLSHAAPAFLANISARVGSITDNGRGGWYSYRASKAAQNMTTKTLSLELKRRAPNVVCVALHPGTVDTRLSQPFQRSVPSHKLFSTERAARQLLAILDNLTPDDSGRFFAWDGTAIPW